MDEMTLDELKASNTEKVQRLGSPPAARLLSARIEALLDTMPEAVRDEVEWNFEDRVAEMLAEREQELEDQQSALHVSTSQLILPS